MKFPVTLLALGTAVALLGGCKTPPKTSETQTKASEAKSETPAAKEEYVMVKPAGSWIPRKVKKKSDILGDNTQVTDARALEKARDQGMGNGVKEGQLSQGSR